MPEKGITWKSRYARSFAFPLQPRRGLGLGFRPASAQRSNRNSSHRTRVWEKDFKLRSWHLGENAAPNEPRIWENIVINNLGNESEARGSHCSLAERKDAGCALWKQRGLQPSWPGSSWPALEAARSPHGPDLGSRSSSAGRLPPCTFCCRSSPERNGPGARPCFGKPWGLGTRKNQDRTPKLGASPDSDVRLPQDPLTGNLPFRKARRSPALCWAGLALLSAPPGASTRYVLQLNLVGFQRCAEVCAHPPLDYIEIMLIDRTKNNSRRDYKTK
uniref:uncharacterized protein LOC114670959 n=1 Tax=Macaca mulatta TaxID=9544 RepID=UPI0010A228E7|nr:uncharacterized protein LOC114670959 [Macaca mulatta]